MYSLLVTLVITAGVLCQEEGASTTPTATTGGTTGSEGLSTDQKIEIGVPVGGTLLTVLVTILVATGIFKCRKKCLAKDLERQPLLHSPSIQQDKPGIAKQTIDVEFAKLISKVCGKLAGSNINIRDLRLFLKTSFPGRTFPQSDIHEIFETLSDNKLWDSWNYHLLKEIVEQFAADDQEIATWIKAYEKKFKQFKGTTRLIHCIGMVFVDSAKTDDEQEISFKLGGSDDSLKQIEKLWNEFADHCGLPLHVARLCSITEGSVLVVWRIPSGIAPKILEAPPPSDKFYHKHGITRVEYGGECIYQEGEFAVSGPGLKSAATNQVSKFTVRTHDTCNQPPPVQQHVSAELKSLVDGSVLQATVVSQTPSTYELSYTPTTRGRHQLTVRVNNTEIGTFQVFVQHPPTQLGTPVRTIDLGVKPLYIAVGDKGELFVTEHWKGQYTVLDARGQRLLTKKLRYGNPTGIATDGEGNVYVASGHSTMTSAHKMQKFKRCGDVVKSVGTWGKHVREFDWLYGVRYHNHHVYVCDSRNGRIQVFDSNLKFVQSFGTHGDGPGQLNRPRDIDFDAQGNIYVLDSNKHQVVVFSEDGQYLRHFGQKGQGEGELSVSEGLCVSGDYVYVAEWGNHCVSVFRTSSEFVHSFGKEGFNRGELKAPNGIAIDRDGFVFVCDTDNNRIQVF